jgi:hypothetical protein
MAIFVLNALKRRWKIMKQAVCPKCMEKHHLTGHHILPLRFFDRKQSNKAGRLYICSKCHSEIERILPLRRKLRIEEYISIHQSWMKGITPNVY